jgi:phosphoenolpyruvate---glycerone phosphotransferase subunit DhaL
MPASTQDVLDLVRAYAGVVAENRDYLIQLDAAIGDADHGENMDRGMRAALAKLDGETPATPADVLKSVATSLISKVGGAAGPLYGTAFLRAATAVQGKESLEPADFVAAITAARDGIVARGKAEPQDKTMVDAWTPAVDAASAAASDGGGVRAVLDAAADAAEQGMRDTIPWVARKGRASYLGERSAGHQDPGATSTALLLRAAADLAGREA